MKYIDFIANYQNTKFKAQIDLGINIILLQKTHYCETFLLIGHATNKIKIMLD